MKFILEINSTKLILSADQIEALANALNTCEQIKHEYIGRSGGTSTYLDLIRPTNMLEVLKLGVLSDSAYDALVFITKQQDTNP
jgi:hypothetical protein